MAAISQDRYQDCDVLLEYGADIDKTAGTLKETALDLVTSVGTLEQMEYLLEKGADPNIPISDNGETEVSYGATPLIEAIINDDFNKVSLLLKFNANPNAKVSNNGLTQQSDGSSVLFISCLNNNYEIAQLLLDAGADPNIPRSDNGKTQSSDGSFPISPAVLNGSSDLVKLLLSYGANPNSTRSDNGLCEMSDGTTVLMEAIIGNSLEKVKILMNAGADVNKSRSGDEAISSHDGGFPLVLASQDESDLEILKILIVKGAKLNQISQTSSQLSSLMTAAYNGNFDAVKVLVEAGADLNIASKKYGTALDNAIDGGHEDIADYLRQHGAIRADYYTEKDN
jgi:uncharacterized protein